jgi:trehalose 6-phosphate phosphatase
MTHLLTDPAGRRLLEDVVGAGGLIAFELDGTLAPIVRDRGGASVGETTRALLAELAAVHPCAVVSGRTRQDALERLHGLPLAEVVGNHGAEPLAAATDELLVRRRVAFWQAVLAASLLEIPGVEIENKRLSLGIHYRRARDRAGAERRIRAAIQRVSGARLVESPCAIDLVPEELPNVGSALKRLCEKLGVGAALFVGVRATRPEVIRAEVPGLVAVRVGEALPGAEWFVADQTQVDDVLRAALEAAARSVTKKAASTAADA